jgi:hypothetical protein
MARRIGIVLLLLASEALGLLSGEWSYRLFRQTVPPVALSQFNQSAAHVAYMGSGALQGVAIFVFCLLAIFLSRFFGKRATAATAAPTPAR